MSAKKKVSAKKATVAKAGAKQPLKKKAKRTPKAKAEEQPKVTKRLKEQKAGATKATAKAAAKSRERTGAEASEAVAAQVAAESAARTKHLKRRVLVTAGPTHEHVDPVRYLTNESTGKMGFEIARAAAARGFEVVLIAGPVALETPRGVRRVNVLTALDMLAALQAEFDNCDALFMAAAVADWRPKRKLAGKWRAKDDGAETATIELVRNPDLLATVTGAASDPRRRPVKKGARLVVGFALETAGGPRRARAKLHKKGADYVILNDPSALGADTTRVTLFGRDGSEQSLTGTKTAVARALVDLPQIP